MLTSRLGMNGAYNYVYGVDGLFRLFGDDYLDIKMARSSDSDLPKFPERFITPDGLMGKTGQGRTGV